MDYKECESDKEHITFEKINKNKNGAWKLGATLTPNTSVPLAYSLNIGYFCCLGVMEDFPSHFLVDFIPQSTAFCRRLWYKIHQKMAGKSLHFHLSLFEAHSLFGKSNQKLLKIVIILAKLLVFLA